MKGQWFALQAKQDFWKKTLKSELLARPTGLAGVSFSSLSSDVPDELVGVVLFDRISSDDPEAQEASEKSLTLILMLVGFKLLGVTESLLVPRLTKKVWSFN